MKRIFAIIVSIMLFFCVSCDKNDDSNIKVISSDFSVNENIKSNYLYQHSSVLNINGHCEPGATLVATLYNEKNSAVFSNSIVVDATGNYNIQVNTPSGSYGKYKLIINDYHKKFVKTYENILFGQVTLIIGNTLIDETIEEVYKQNIDSLKDKLYIYDLTEEDSSWVTVSQESTIYNFMYHLYNVYCSDEYRNMPIGFVNVIYNQMLLEELISNNNIFSSQSVLKYLTEHNKYKENPLNKGDSSYIIKNILSKIHGLAVGDIIVSTDINEFKDIYLKSDYPKIYNIYARMLLGALKSVDELIYRYNNLSIIQAGSYEYNNIYILRDIQSKISNIVEDTYLIPTYDLNNLPTKSLNLAERYYNIVYDKKDVTEYANHFISDEDHTITIEFNNSYYFTNDFINLFVYDKTGSIIKFNDGKIKAQNGFPSSIIIDLSYEVEVIDEETGETIIETRYYEVSKICYGNIDNLNEHIIFNRHGIPVVPFTIIIDTLDEV